MRDTRILAKRGRRANCPAGMDLAWQAERVEFTMSKRPTCLIAFAVANLISCAGEDHTPEPADAGATTAATGVLTSTASSSTVGTSTAGTSTAAHSTTTATTGTTSRGQTGSTGTSAALTTTATSADDEESTTAPETQTSPDETTGSTQGEVTDTATLDSSSDVTTVSSELANSSAAVTTSETPDQTSTQTNTPTSGESAVCGVLPVNPNATREVKNLLCYLYSIYGEGVLSGQQETSWNPNPADDVDWINSQTGKFPAILGGDYLYPDGTTARAKAWWDAGGITMIRYHMGAPPSADTYENSKGSANIDNVLRSGSSENTSFNSKLDYIAVELQILEDANVPVIWAPFHEVQPNGWFWWSKGTSAQFIALWKYMFEYLTTQKGLNNLVWLMPFSGTPDGNYYPGKEWLDLAGPDTYDKGQPFAGMYSQAKGIIGSEVPIPLHETGVIPDPAAMFPSSAPWLLFNIWAGYQKDTAQNSVAQIKATYAHERTITRDEVPNLK